MCKNECNGQQDCNCENQTEGQQLSQTFEQTIQGIEAWGTEKGIYAESNVSKQLSKFLEETEEVKNAINFLVCFKSIAFPKDLSISEQKFETFFLRNVELEIGDVIVTLVGICKFLGLNLPTCAALTLQKIQKRKGKMIDGFFVKDNE